MIRLELLENYDEEKWDNLVTTYPHGSIFHTSTWMNTIALQKNAEKLPFGIFHGNDMVGLIPFFRVRKGPFKILASPLGVTGYGGALAESQYHHEIIKQVDALAKELKAHYIDFRTFEPLSTTFLNAMHYETQPLQTIILPLDQDIETLWSNLKGSCRTYVRKARKQNVQIIEAKDPQYLEKYYSLSVATFEKANRTPPLSKEDYQIAWDNLHPQQRLKVFFAQHEGEVVAGAMILVYNKKIYYWDGASSPAYYHLSPNNLLHWHIIEWGARNNMLQYDMLGANIPSIAKFKLSFGGKLEKYLYAYKDTNYSAYIGHKLYRNISPRLRQISRKLTPHQA